MIGSDPVARIAGRGAAALEPQMFGYAPVEAAEIALRRAGIAWRDVGAVELNEAFAVQSLACIDAWPVDPDIVNSRGGAIAIGHPLGASGGRILGTLAKVLRGGRASLGACCDLHRRRAGPRGCRWRTSNTSQKRGIDGHRASATLTKAVAGIADGSTVLIGGFGTAGQPVELIDALIRSGASGSDGRQQQCRQRPGRAGRPARRTVRSARSSAHFHGRPTPTSSTSSIEPARWSSSWCLRAIWPNGCGLPAPGSGRSSAPLASGHLSAEGKERRTIDGRDYVLEYPIKGDVALIKALRADTLGNLVYRKTARNFGPVMAMAAQDHGRTGRRDRSAGWHRPGGRDHSGNLRRPHACRSPASSPLAESGQPG